MRRDHLLLAAFVLSGAAGLGFEILWTRLLALALGSESLGMLGVLSGFFGGLALGSAKKATRLTATARSCTRCGTSTRAPWSMPPAWRAPWSSRA